MIYLLEDDDSIRKLVVYTLNSQGMNVQGYDRPSAFWAAVEQEAPELVLLDVMLPEQDGLSVLEQLRARASTENVPVIMLTAKNTEYDKVVGLDSGADDYIAKPFGMMELVSRVKAVLRRSGGEKQGTDLCYGDISLNTAKHTVTVCGQAVTLTLKEFELLHMLMENKGIVLTRDTILNKIWGYRFDGESRTVDVHVRTLRQKLGQAGNLVETVRGVGYRIGDGK